MSSPEKSNVLSFGTFYALLTCKISKLFKIFLKIHLESFQYTGYYLCIHQRECVSTKLSSITATCQRGEQVSPNLILMSCLKWYIYVYLTVPKQFFSVDYWFSSYISFELHGIIVINIASLLHYIKVIRVHYAQ